MKKLIIFLTVVATTLALNAATVDWTVDDLGWPKTDNNKEIAGETLTINDNLSIEFSNGEGTSPVIYRLTTNDQASYIAFYSKNVMTINATDATITSVTFVVDEDADAAQTTQTSPGWSVKVGGVTYKIDNPTWTGSASSVEVTCNSKTALLGLSIEYTAEGDGNDSEGGDKGDDETAATADWTVDDLGWPKTDNNKELAGETLTINDNLSIEFSNGEGTSPVIYRLTTNDQASYIAFYSKNVMTINATDATITSVTFVVDEDADAAQTTQTSPGWSVKVGGTTYNIDNPTWRGSASSVEVTCNSKTALLGLSIEYTAEGDGNDSEGGDKGDDETAATADWTVDDLGWPKTDNNKELAGETLTINDNLSIEFSNGEGTSPVIYRLTTNDQASYIAFYSKNVMTINATDATITSVTFVVDEDADAAQTTQTSPGWSVKVGGTTYNIDNPTWTGSASSVEVTCNSKTALLGLSIEYTAEGDGNEPGGDDDNTQDPGNNGNEDDENGDDDNTQDPGDNGDEGDNDGDDDNTQDPGDNDDEGDEKGDDDNENTPDINGVFFSPSHMGSGEDVQDVTITDEETGFSVQILTSSAAATIDLVDSYFGDENGFVTLGVRCQPGDTSNNGIDSDSKATLTFPSDGVLSIYAYNLEGSRSLNLVDASGETLWTQLYNQDDYVTVTPDNDADAMTKSVDEGNQEQNIRVYPVYTTNVEEGTAYLLWPDGDLVLYGFGFESDFSGVKDLTHEGNALENEEDAPMYDLLGRQVTKNYKGLVIRNGKKYILR